MRPKLSLTVAALLSAQLKILKAARLGADLAPVRIHNRVAYSRAQQTGLTAQEFETDGKAADEIKQLNAYACIHLFPIKMEVANVRAAKLSASRS
jgi:hypothetical protein